MRPWTTRSDAQLLNAASLDSDAFAELYRRHEPVVAIFLARRCRDVELTADLTAETFATALLRADRFYDDGGPAIGWLLGIARHQLLHALRRGRVDDSARARLGAEPIATTDASLERAELLIDAAAAGPRLRRALAALPHTQRDAICAYVLDDQPYDVVAEQLGVSEPTVRQRVSRGLARMKTTLDGTR